jgi:putative methanogenesis marker protein 8
MHELLCRGARVLIRDGKVEVLTDPAVCSCPYVKAVYKIDRIDKEAVKRIVEEKIRCYGYFSPNRCLKSDAVVPFGSSEMISSVMGDLIDCAVVVCDGAGSVITWNPDLVQGIGARMNGLISTSPIKEVIDRIREGGGDVLDNPRIDQVEAVRKAVKMGFKRIAVTVIGLDASSIPELRNVEREAEISLVIFSTCNTLIREEDVRHLELADIVCASASRIVRERIGPKAKMQLGISIPVFILTERGKKIALRYIEKVKSPVLISRARMPYIVEEKLPVLCNGCICYSK